MTSDLNDPSDFDPDLIEEPPAPEEATIEAPTSFDDERTIDGSPSVNTEPLDSERIVEEEPLLGDDDPGLLLDDEALPEEELLVDDPRRPDGDDLTTGNGPGLGDDNPTDTDGGAAWHES